MKDFYSNILHLPQIWEDETSIAYKIGDHQLSIELDTNLPTPPKAFAFQPGWREGTAHTTSWSLECDKEDFFEIVKSATTANINRYFDAPKWLGYWSFPLLDPMHNTIEITCSDQNYEA